MQASDILKLAASVAAGSLTYEAAAESLSSDGDRSVLDSILAGGAGLAAGGLVGGLLDATGISGIVDDIFNL